MNGENTSINAYLRTKVLTAPPEQLRLFLLDGAIKFARQGVEALKAKNWEGVYTGFTQSRNIVLELTNSIRPELDPVLAQRMQGLYTFIYMQLVESGFEKDIAKGEKAIELLEYERETWMMLIDKLAAERAGGPTTDRVPDAPIAPERPAPAAFAGTPVMNGVPGSSLGTGVQTPRRPTLSIQG